MRIPRRSPVRPCSTSRAVRARCPHVDIAVARGAGVDGTAGFGGGDVEVSLGEVGDPADVVESPEVGEHNVSERRTCGSRAVQRLAGRGFVLQECRPQDDGILPGRGSKAVLDTEAGVPPAPIISSVSTSRAWHNDVPNAFMVPQLRCGPSPAVPSLRGDTNTGRQPTATPLGLCAIAGPRGRCGLEKLIAGTGGRGSATIPVRAIFDPPTAHHGRGRRNAGRGASASITVPASCRCRCTGRCSLPEAPVVLPRPPNRQDGTVGNAFVSALRSKDQHQNVGVTAVKYRRQSVVWAPTT